MLELRLLRFRTTQNKNEILFLALMVFYLSEKELGGKVNNFDATEDREASKESHGTTNETQLRNKGHLIIKLNCCIEAFQLSRTA